MQIVEISGERRYLCANRGFLAVREKDEELGRIPLDGILGLIGAGHGITLSQSLLVRLADLGIPYVVCDQSFSPVSVTWPLSGRHNQTKVIRKQLAAKKPLKKQLWKDLVRAKIEMQARVLSTLGMNNTPLRRMTGRVKSGDPENIEAHAARVYWRELFGSDFRRQRSGPAPNAILNYGYTVFRSAVARAVVACGLHPSAGLCHKNQYNTLVLVDDLLEPFRPYVDLITKTLFANHEALDAECKHALVNGLHLSISGERGSTELLKHIHRLVRSVSQSFLDSKPMLVLPAPTELELAAVANA